jgi:hypothetical protein
MTTRGQAAFRLRMAKSLAARGRCAEAHRQLLAARRGGHVGEKAWRSAKAAVVRCRREHRYSPKARHW